MKKEEMLQEMEKILRKLYYEDLEFIYKFVAGYARKKGII